jgi:endonuclease YncB( thermonuclease family)
MRFIEWIIAVRPVHLRPVIASNSKRLLAGLAALLLALACHAQEKKWMTLDCAYLADKSNDGDSFLVQCGREKFFVRLYFVDAPETDVEFPDRVRQQYDYFGVAMDDLTRGGSLARDYVQRLLAPRRFAVHTRKVFAQGRSKLTRYYGLVQVEGRYLHEMLLEEGLARNKGTRVALPTGHKARAHANALQAIEDRARAFRRGVWANYTPSKRVLDRPR